MQDVLPISLSIIIVNYRSADLIDGCLNSIFQFNLSLNYEIIIVDNDSKEDKEIIQKKFPDIRWIQMGYNAGFARANNEGIRQSSGDIVLLLNPDILVEENSIEKCYERFRQSDYVACGVQLLNPDRTPQISGNYFITGGINNFLPLPFLGRIFKWMGTTLKVKKTNIPEAKGEVEVDWVNGAFIMVKKTVIEKAGPLDEDFFLYAEEIEWCSRLGKYGRLCIYGDLHVIHLQGAVANEIFSTSGKGYFNLSDKKGKQIMLSNFVRIRKQFGAAWFLIHLFVYVIEIPLFFIMIIFQKLTGKKQGYSFSQFRGFINNLIFLIDKAGVIIRNKPYFYKVL